MKKILLHNANNNVIRGINKFIAQVIDVDKYNILFNSWHGKLLEVYQKYKPEYVLWPASEYSQEFQDFVQEYSKQTKIFLIVDVEIPHDNLNNFLNQSNVKIIIDSKIKTEYRNTIIKYTNPYDTELFFDQKKDRNGKTAVILSLHNTKNKEMLDNILYPNDKHDIVVFNNAEFESPVNLGLTNYNDIAEIMAVYSKVVDLDNIFEVEASACNIDYVDLTSSNVDEALTKNLLKVKIADLPKYSLESLAKDIIKHIG